MAKVFITGSADGLGQLATKALINLGHQVVIHARNEERAQQALDSLPGAAEVLIADLSSIEATKLLAKKADRYGMFDVVIHNAGVYHDNSLSVEGLPVVLVVNSLAPYILTCLMQKPKRLMYLSSNMHFQGNPNLEDLSIETGRKGTKVTYSDTKLHNLILAMAVARRWTNVYSNAVDPGWVPTKMGGSGAPDSLEKGYETQLWLSMSDEPQARVSGHYFHHKKQTHFLQAAKDKSVQDNFLTICHKITGVSFNDK